MSDDVVRPTNVEYLYEVLRNYIVVGFRVQSEGPQLCAGVVYVLANVTVKEDLIGRFKLDAVFANH